MAYRLEPVRDRRTRRLFVDLPRALLGTMPAFVPPLTSEEVKRLDPGRNPFFQHADSALWILFQGRRPAGRISATVDRLALEWNEDATGVFGHFLAPDAAGAACLLEAARTFLRGHGLARMRGPIELSTNYTCGLQVTAFDQPPRVQMNQHPPGQEELLREDGLEPVKDLLALCVHRKDLDLTRLERGHRIALRRSRARLRAIDVRRFATEVEILHGVYQRSWSRNFGFVPASREEFRHTARDLKRIVDPRLCHIAEIDGQAAGFILGLPDLNVGIKACDGRLFPFGFLRLLRATKETDRFRVITLGVVPEARRLGLESSLIMEIIEKSMQVGYHDAELSWILEDNVLMLRPLIKMGAVESTRYRLFEQAL